MLELIETIPLVWTSELHRLPEDGIHAAQMAKTFKELFSDPEKILLAD